MKEGFPVSFFISFSDGHQVYLTSSNQDSDDGFIMETKVLKDAEGQGARLRKSGSPSRQSVQRRVGSVRELLALVLILERCAMAPRHSARPGTEAVPGTSPT